MTIDLTVAGSTATTRTRPVFYRVMAGTMLAATVVGFSNSEIQRPDTGPPLPLFIGAHAVLFASWLVIFVVQTSLVAHARVATHRRLGTLAAFVAAAMVLTGPPLAISSVRRGTMPSADPLAFMLVMIGDVI